MTDSHVKLPVTARWAFGEVSPNEPPLFSINEGISLRVALEEMEQLLGFTRAIANGAIASDGALSIEEGMEPMVRMLDIAQALTTSIQVGLDEWSRLQPPSGQPQLKGDEP